MKDKPEFQLQTASEKAYKVIRQNILNGNLPPGASLPRRKMSKLSGVSVIPVIEAMQQLEADGLVRSKPRWGSYVTPVTQKEILDSYALREAIECHAVRILTQKWIPDREQRLRRLARNVDESPYSSEENVSRTWDAHYLFHRALAEETGCDSLVRALDKINLYALLVRAVVVHRQTSDPPPKDWHNRVLDAIARGDPTCAEEMMRIHIHEGLHRLLGLYQDSASPDPISSME